MCEVGYELVTPIGYGSFGIVRLRITPGLESESHYQKVKFIWIGGGD